LKIVSWNIGRRAEAWRHLTSCNADIALLQEAAPPPLDVSDAFEVDPAPWTTEGQGQRPWRTAIVRLSSAVHVECIGPASLSQATTSQFAVSRLGTISAARVSSDDLNEPITVVSMYGLWERPYASTGSNWIYADASAHRLVSDLSGFVGQEANHNIIAAGDLNILNGYGDHGSTYWKARYATVFERFAALGLSFVGPQAPHGRQAKPWPTELPGKSKNVPTFFSSQQQPASATRQLDFVFASNSLAKTLKVIALNERDQWGPSDHCQLEVEIDS
jgi:endonuclease/exonuclease/phosphatase family metal-dependent hydrolase